MTDTECNECSDPPKLLKWLQRRGRLSERHERLFSCACVRRVWCLLRDARSRCAVACAERYADGAVPERQREEVEAAARDVVTQFHWPKVNAADPASRVCRATGFADGFAAEAAWLALGRPLLSVKIVQGTAAADVLDRLAAEAVCRAVEDPMLAVAAALTTSDAYVTWPRPRRAACIIRSARDDVRGVLAALLRDISGDPFSPLPRLVPSLLVPEVVQLAEAACEHRSLPSGHLDPVRLAVLADALESAGCQDAALLGHLRGEGPHVRGCAALDAVLGRS
jgi:hypothetical protein